MFKRIIKNRIFVRHTAFVPAYKAPVQEDFDKLREFLIKNKQLLVLTGAGISTESGIPDYRSEEVGLYARSNHKPIQYQEFVKYPRVRQRYWARNFVGWPRFSAIKPNATHHVIRDLEKIGKVSSVVTQNVDRLHHKAGSMNVIELHGSGYIVKCLNCPYEIDRFKLQDILMKNNPSMKSSFDMIRPDGDVELSKEQVENFRTPLCPECEGPLKPDIVFFGDNVPKQRVEQVRNEAKEEGKEVAILNIGPTRADDMADLKVSTKCGDILVDICKTIM
ncbi:hypothetical protein KGM_206876 [Danaus plexippus plexippus]|uniref:Deacetylase sirtuin-type domain-containing protein n=1 Tax=Danaus plexippus plexippus TaxID=278856 RepID=A0A212FMM6_DANPL|nr:hypothetical protein KGM_206876 [Danaus plexippus plexippus]